MGENQHERRTENISGCGIAQSFKALACEQDGAAKLSDGAKKLSDAMIQFNEEGIQKLSDAYHGDVEELF